MAFWYYYDNDGRKMGPYAGSQLQWFAKQGTITPETVLETEAGNSVSARSVKGLFAEPPSPPPPPVEENPFSLSAPEEANPFTVSTPTTDTTATKSERVPGADPAELREASAPLSKERTKLFFVSGILVVIALGGFLFFGATGGLGRKASSASPADVEQASGSVPPPFGTAKKENGPVPVENRSRRERDGGFRDFAPAPSRQNKAAESTRRTDIAPEQETPKNAATAAEEPGAAAPRAKPAPKPVAVSVAGALNWDEEFKKSGFGNVSIYLGDFLTYGGSVALRDRNNQAASHLDRVDVFDKAEARKKVDAVNTEIKAAREKLAKKIFYVVRFYSAGNVKDFGDGSGSFTMYINTPFDMRKRKLEFHVPLPVPDVTNNGIVENSGSGISLPISGDVDGIKELVRNKDKYQVRVWFTDFNRTRTAEVLKIEVSRVGTPPAQDGRNAAKPNKDDFSGVAANYNFLETFLPKRKRGVTNKDGVFTPEEIISDMSVDAAFTIMRQFEQQDWKALGNQTAMLTFTINDKDGKRSQAKILFKTDESYLMIDGRRLDQKDQEKFFNIMYNELKKELGSTPR